MVREELGQGQDLEWVKVELVMEPELEKELEVKAEEMGLVLVAKVWELEWAEQVLVLELV